MYFKCHNCGSGLGVANFLKSYFPVYHEQYLLEKYKSGVDTKPTRTATEIVPKVVLNSFRPLLATKISELPDEHYAKQYVLRRQIPTHVHSKIFFTADFSKLVDEVFPNKYSNLSEKEPRLVIPFFDTDSKLLGLQGRSFSPEKALRYITIRANGSTNLVYGLERIDRTKPVYVVEGPLDSLFIPNCLAAANSDLSSVLDKVDVQNAVLIFDNEPRNKEIVSLLEESIKKNRKVCIWPHTIAQKDINDMILSGVCQSDLIRMIENRTFVGLQAQLEFCKWKKV